jgi:hypothetical protein
MERWVPWERRGGGEDGVMLGLQEPLDPMERE